jgi:hypothetical protein
MKIQTQLIRISGVTIVRSAAGRPGAGLRDRRLYFVSGVIFALIVASVLSKLALMRVGSPTLRLGIFTPDSGATDYNRLPGAMLLSGILTNEKSALAAVLFSCSISPRRAV